jgi:hypothetical protein
MTDAARDNRATCMLQYYHVSNMRMRLPECRATFTIHTPDEMKQQGNRKTHE